jgi:superfamily I DNA/RNA helicase
MPSAWWIGDDELDSDQQAVTGIEGGGSHLVLGPPGSGKTNILLLRANYLTLAGKPNIAIVVFTRTLKKFIASGGKEYQFPDSKIMTSNAWQKDVLHQYGVPLNLPTDFDQQRKYLAEQIAELIKREKLKKIYDAILLDEAQDYTPDEISLFKQLAGELFAVADSRQQIYKDEAAEAEPLAAIRAAVDKVHELKFHYRNGRRICELADLMMKDKDYHQSLLEYCNYNESANPSSVTIFKGSLADQCREIAAALRNQLKVYPSELLAVVCAKREHVDEVFRLLQGVSDIAPKLCKIDEDDAAFDGTKPICVSTIHGAKGLEVRALHFAAAEHVKKVPHQRKVGFTAITRAKTSLGIYHEDELKGWFEGAVEGLKPPKPTPSLSDLFKRK